MSDILQQHKALYGFLSHPETSEKQAVALIKLLSKAQAKGIGEIADNFIKGVIDITETHIKQLKPKRAIIRQLASKKSTAENKRKLIAKHPKVVYKLLHFASAQLQELLE